MTEPTGDQLELIVTTTEKFVQLRHDQIHPNPNNVRTDLGDLHDLEESIWNVGLLEPLRVQRNEDGYELVAGERRWTAIGNLIAGGFVEPAWGIDCLVQDTADLQTVTEQMLIENLHRKDLTPIEEMTGFVRLAVEFGLTTAQIAERTGVPESTVKSRVSWAKLPQHVLDAFSTGRYRIQDLDELAKLPASDLAEFTANGKTPQAHEIDSLRRQKNRKAKAAKIRARLEKAGHHVLGSWSAVDRLRAKTDVPETDPEYAAWAKLRANAEAARKPYCSGHRKWIDEAKLTETLAELAPGEVFVLSVDTWSLSLYRDAVVDRSATSAAMSEAAARREAEAVAAMSDAERAYHEAYKVWEEAHEQWERDVAEAELTWLREAKPAELIAAYLDYRLATRYNYRGDDAVQKQLGIEVDDLKAWARQSAANRIRVLMADVLDSADWDIPGLPVEPEEPVHPDHVDVDDVDEDDGPFDDEDDDELADGEAEAIAQVQAEHEAELAENPNFDEPGDHES